MDNSIRQLVGVIKSDPAVANVIAFTGGGGGTNTGFIYMALKPLNEAAPRWLGTLRALAGEPGFDLARKEAIESGEDLTDQAKRLLTEQTEYFDLHKDERGQDRAEPK